MPQNILEDVDLHQKSNHQLSMFSSSYKKGLTYVWNYQAEILKIAKRCRMTASGWKITAWALPFLFWVEHYVKYVSFIIQWMCIYPLG